MEEAAALNLVYDAIDVVNGLRRPDDQLSKEPNVQLMGDKGRLDSLSLATLLLTLERRLEDVTGTSISLLDELGGDLARFETPQAIAELVREKCS